MNKAQIIAELHNMVVARLGRPWPADREAVSAVRRKLKQMGLVEQVRDEPLAWRITPLGEELDVDLFADFMGVTWAWEVPITLERAGLLSESECDAIFECTSETDAETLLAKYVKRAYFDYRNRRTASKQ